MNKDILSGKWKQIEGDVRMNWGKLTHDDIEKVKGSFDRLVGVVQERYGYNKQQATTEVSNFLTHMEEKVEKNLKQR